MVLGKRNADMVPIARTNTVASFGIQATNQTRNQDLAHPHQEARGAAKEAKARARAVEVEQLRPKPRSG